MKKTKQNKTKQNKKQKTKTKNKRCRTLPTNLIFSSRLVRNPSSLAFRDSSLYVPAKLIQRANKQRSVSYCINSQRFILDQVSQFAQPERKSTKNNNIVDIHTAFRFLFVNIRTH